MARQALPPFDERSNNPWCDGLNAQQTEAVLHRDGPLLVVAGPGSGKTRVVTYRIAQLLSAGVRPSQILALTFTNKAADEMKRRVATLVPEAAVTIGTFHRFCVLLLRRYARLVGLTETFSIFDADDTLQLCREILKQNPKYSLSTTPSELLHRISHVKSKGILASEFSSRHADQGDFVLEALYPEYQQNLLRCNAADFDDLLLHVATILRSSPDLRRDLDSRYRYIMVDEYQDTNVVQYAIVRALSVDHPNLAATGDPDQSIYGWRGADIRNILEFEKDYPSAKVVRLEQNYRSTPNILKVADGLIAHNRFRKPKLLFTETSAGAPVSLTVFQDHFAEADGVSERIIQTLHAGASAREFAILYRASHQSRILEQSLRRRGIPYQIVRGTSFFQRKEVKDVLAYLQLIQNERHDLCFLRILNIPRRGLGHVAQRRLQNFAEQQVLSLLAASGDTELHRQLSKPAAKSMARMHDWIRNLQSTPSQGVGPLVRRIVEESGYLDQLRGSNVPEEVERAENLEELIGDAVEFDLQHPDGGLDGFLERIALINDVDAWDPTSERVTLMTLHAAKGLEFPRVFVVGIEHDLLPHRRSQDDEMQLEEERRLLFVGITRAEQELYLSFARQRMQNGSMRTTIASQFLLEIPRESVLCHDASVSVGPADRESFEEELWDGHDEICLDHDGDGDEECAEDDSALDTYVPIVRPAPPRDTEPPRTKIEPAARLDPPSLSGPDRAIQEAELRLGSTVVHPDYGPGKLIRITGQPPRRSVTVQFALAGSAQTFIWELSPLRPSRAANVAEPPDPRRG